MSQPAVKWRARIVWEFECPRCGLVLAEGNPLDCPHQQGAPLYHEWEQPTPVPAKTLEEAWAGCVKPGG